MKNKLISLFATSLLLVCGSANASFIYSTTDTIDDGSRAHFAGFESTVYDFSDLNFQHSEDNILITSSDGDISNLFNGTREGANSWYHNGGDNGYSTIQLADGGDINSIGMLVGHGWGAAERTIFFELFNNDSLVFSGSVGNWVAGYLGFSGGTFDEVRMIAVNDTSGFSFIGDGTFQAIALDAIEVGSVSEVPEPATFGLFGLALLAMRRMTKN